MDIDKFNYLLSQESLYLCRADKLHDRFEGRYSQQQIEDMTKWLTDQGLCDVDRGEVAYRQRAREKTYISCWCMGNYDYDLMWKGYIRTPPGIAIKSTVAELQAICDHNVDKWPLDLSMVNYYPQAEGKFINYDRISPFVHKDVHFTLDNEIRIIQWGNWGEPSPDHLELQVYPEQLIKSVHLSPRSSSDDVQHVKQILHEHALEHVPIMYSRDDRTPID